MALSHTLLEAVEVLSSEDREVREVTKTVKGAQITTRETDASPAALVLIKRANVLADRIKAMEAERDQIKDTLGDMMEEDGLNRIVFEGKNRVSRSVTIQNRINPDKLREEYPQVAEMVTYQTSPITKVIVS